MIVFINKCYEQNESIDTSLVYICLQPTQLDQQAIWGMGQSVVKKVRDRKTIRGKTRREDSGIDIGLGISAQRADPSTSELQDIMRMRSDDMPALSSTASKWHEKCTSSGYRFGGTAQKSPLSPVLKVLVLVIVGRFIDDK